jgi:hypothetical protein
MNKLECGNFRGKVVSQSIGVLIAAMLSFGTAYADSIQVGCQFYDQEANLVGDGEYTYDPSVSDSLLYNTPSGEQTYETNYATEFHPNITFYSGEEWTGGNYQFTDSILNIWGGDEPGTIKPEGLSPYQTIDSGWHKYPPGKCSGCGHSVFSMNWSSTSEGTWEGAHRNQNNVDPNTGTSEYQAASGHFTCENSAPDTDFGVYPDAMGVEGAVSTFVAYVGTDAYEGTDLQYSWAQTEGPLATKVVEQETQVLRVTVPNLDADTVLKFTVSAGEVTKEIVLPVLNFDSARWQCVFARNQSRI